MLPSCVLFDLDGTLLDSLPGIEHSVRHACQVVGVPCPEVDLRSLLGPPIRIILGRALRIEDERLLDRLESAYRAHYDTEGWNKTNCFAGAREMLETLKDQGRRLFVISNKPLRVSLQILQFERLESFFDRIYTLDSRLPPYGSKAEMIRDFLDVYEVSSLDCLMVGDTIEDVTASAVHGMAAAWMEHGYGAIPQDLHVLYRFRSFAEFLDVVAAGSAG